VKVRLCSDAIFLECITPDRVEVQIPTGVGADYSLHRFALVDNDLVALTRFVQLLNDWQCRIVDGGGRPLGGPPQGFDRDVTDSVWPSATIPPESVPERTE
jgi:hypothetical protein